MLFLSADDFFEKAKSAPGLTRDEERSCAARMKAGDPVARDRIVEGYLLLTASVIKHHSERARNLSVVYACIRTLEGAVDRFDFLQDSESFAHYLSIRLKNCIISCLLCNSDIT